MSSILQVERLTERQLRQAVLATMRELAEKETDPLVRDHQLEMAKDFEDALATGRDDGGLWAKTEVGIRAFLRHLTDYTR